MPELIEVEMYRLAAEQAVGRRVVAVDAGDAWYLKRGATAATVADALVGARIEGTSRRGKLLMLRFDNDVVLGLRFGMTGRIVVDGGAPIAELEYSSHRVDPAWDRFSLHLDDGGSVVISDPRRLGGVELDPDLTRLGPDAATITFRQLRQALGGSTAPLKAVLLDQARVSGLGNLLVDEILWRDRIDPRRSAGALTETDLRDLAGRIRSTVRLLTRRGGSHTGDLMAHRQRGGHCPRCGAALRRESVGGRTTYWCPEEQRR